MISIAGVEYELQQSDRGALLVKAGKPCGKGWIAEKKRCDPQKLQHAIQNRRPDLERYANIKREAKGLRPKQNQEVQDLSLNDLEASDKMLEVKSLRPKREVQDISIDDLVSSDEMEEQELQNVSLDDLIPSNKVEKQEFQDISLDDLKSSDEMEEQEFQDISLDDLEASDKMLEESLAMFDVPIRLALTEPPLKFEDALNNIVPFNKGQEKVVRALRADLLDLQNLAKEFVMEQDYRKLSDSLDALKDELSNNKIYMEAIESDILKNQVAKLNRLYNGKITQSDAEIAATLTRVFHALHPRKQIKMPKGTTQADYLGIVNKLLDGDKKALKQYTVTRPSKKKKK